jgi:formylglycine-generating enzyme required for sulfatase activity/tetratricopeptide (TPR) repeat protein
MSSAESRDRVQSTSGGWRGWLRMLSIQAAWLVVGAVVLWLHLRHIPSGAGLPRDLAAGRPEADDPALEKGLSLYRGLPKKATHPCGLELVLLPPGKFRMGLPPEEQGLRLPGPGKKPVPIIDPQTEVTLAEPYYLGVHEVAQEQYDAVMGVNPSLAVGPRQPVERVTWEDALKFCRMLGERDGQTYRLPTEAEWEYACRAGTTTPFHFGATASSEQANFDTDAPSKWSGGGANRGKPLPVGSFPANAFGLHDMHGNVAEWCLDLYPSSGGFYHNLRGGGWDQSAHWCRSAARQGLPTTSSPAIGFRVLRTTTPDPRWRLGPAPGEGGPVDTAAWARARIDEAFAKPAKPLLPGVVVFPPVYAKDPAKNTWFKGLSEIPIVGALTYSLAASMAVAYGPERRMALSPQMVIEAFQGEKIGLDQRTPLDDPVIARCLEKLGCKLYVVARLTHEDQIKRVFVEMHGDAAHPDRTRDHPVPFDNLSFIPGLIALDVLDWLGVKPEEIDVARIQQALCKGDDGSARLGDLMQPRPSEASDDKRFNDFLTPKASLTVWQLYLNGAVKHAEALDRFDRARAALPPCDLLKIRQAALLRASGRLREAFDLLLSLAPTHRGDPYYHAQLVRCAMAMGEEGLVDHLFQDWKKQDPGLPGSLMRGGQLVDWAWEIRGDGLAETVTKEAFDAFHKRLEHARNELEAAAAQASKTPDAHRQLITVAMGLGLPREYADKHFRAAVAADPKHGTTYFNYFNYLMPRWHGQPAEMLAFGRECVKSGLWEEGVPGLFITAVQDIAFDGETGLYRREIFRDPIVWEGLKDYYEQTGKMGQMTPRNAEPWALFNDRVCSYYLLWGSFCGKRAELEDGLNRIVHPDLAVFPDYAAYYHVRDLVRAETGKGAARLTAKVRVALAAGDFDEAERILGQDADWPPAAGPDRERLRLAAAQGRRLAQDGMLKLSPRDILDAWTVQDKQFWQVRGKSLVCSQPEGKVASIHCPFPLGAARIKGELECRGGLHSAQIILHARAAIDPVRILFSPNKQAQTVGLARYNANLGVQPMTPGPQPFLIDAGPRHDRVVVNDQGPGMLTPLPTFAPGGLSFESYTTVLSDGEFVLGPLEITLQGR